MTTKNYLAEITAENTSFSKLVPGLQLVWDTVSTGALKECPRYYYLTTVEGWQPKGQNPHLLFGLVGHSAQEVYDHAIIAGQPYIEAVRLAVRHCMEATGTREDVLRCAGCGKITRNLEATHCLGCNEAALEPLSNHYFPWVSDHPNKNLRTLIRTIVWYFEHYKNSEEKTVVLSDGSPAVELWFRFELQLISPEGNPYILTGHIDKLVEYSGSRWFKDLKTTKNTIGDNFFAKFSPDNQMSFYATAGKIVFKEPIVGGLIDGAQVAVGFSKFQRGLVYRTEAQLEEWLKDIQILLKEAESYAINAYWPMRDTSCHHYGGCDFVGVCNKDPKVRERYLKTKFVRRIWDPLKKR